MHHSGPFSSSRSQPEDSRMSPYCGHRQHKPTICAIQVVEAGPHIRESPDHVQPARYFSNLALPKETYTFHKSDASPALLGRSVIVPSGRAVGGGSAVNCKGYS